MNDIAKQAISDKLKDALKNEGLTGGEASKISGIIPSYLSQTKTLEGFKRVPKKTWEKLREWTNSGLTFMAYDWNTSGPKMEGIKTNESEQPVDVMEANHQAENKDIDLSEYHEKEPEPMERDFIDLLNTEKDMISLKIELMNKRIDAIDKILKLYM